MSEICKACFNILQRVQCMFVKYYKNTHLLPKYGDAKVKKISFCHSKIKLPGKRVKTFGLFVYFSCRIIIFVSCGAVGGV